MSAWRSRGAAAAAGLRALPTWRPQQGRLLGGRFVCSAVLAISSCADPALDPLGEALAAWDEGQRAWQAGDAEAARRAFAQARALDPQSPALCVWESTATAAVSGPDAALVLLDGCVALTPGDPGLHLARARLRASTGGGPARSAAVAADLEVVLRAGAETPTSLSAYAELAPLADDPALGGMVRSAAPRWTLRGGLGAVLVGERFDVQVEGEGSDGPLRVDLGAGEGLAVAALVEDLGPLALGRRARSLTVRAVAARAGLHAVGPIALSIGDGAPVSLGPVTIERIELNRREDGPLGIDWSGELLAPSDARARAEPGAIARIGAWVVVASAAPHPPRFEAEAPPHAILELREGGQPVWFGALLAAGTGGRVQVADAEGAVRTHTLPSPALPPHAAEPRP